MRRRRPERREILPDPLFGDLVVAKFVNNLMLDGKKSVSFRLFYDALEIVNEKIEEEGERGDCGETFDVVFVDLGFDAFRGRFRVSFQPSG